MLSQIAEHTIPITVPKDANQELVSQAKETATFWGVDFKLTAKQGLALFQQSTHLELRQLDEPNVGAVIVDFASNTATHRRKHGGGRGEAVAKAVGLKGQKTWCVLDATAGLGRDAFVLASLGCRVDMIERSPIVAALLQDGLNRAATDSELSTWLPEKMQLHHGVATELLANWQGIHPDVVYLDPMFPHRKKSAAVKKEMRLFQQLLGPDEDADLLLTPALALAKKRVVVKRPAGAPYLADKKPDIEMAGKANRFDIYLIHITSE